MAPDLDQAREAQAMRRILAKPRRWHPAATLLLLLVSGGAVWAGGGALIALVVHQYGSGALAWISGGMVTLALVIGQAWRVSR